jgi:hypothetical protein
MFSIRGSFGFPFFSSRTAWDSRPGCPAERSYFFGEEVNNVIYVGSTDGFLYALM